MTELFKPFRNYLRRYDAESFLRSIWALASHVEFNQPLPPYLAGALQPAGPFQPPPMLPLWEFDTLAREVILHCATAGGVPVDRWPIVRDAINHLRRVEEEALIVDDFDVFAELSRIAHRQFHWQSGFNMVSLARYQVIYSYPGIDTAIRADFGMGTDDFFLGCFGLLATLMNHSALGPDFMPTASKMLGVDFEPIVARFTSTLPELREMGMRARSLDENWAYSFHPLRQFPLISMKGGSEILCPVPGLLARRFTDGLYFDLGKGKDVLSRELGPAFQAYVGDVLEASAGSAYRVQAERSYGSAKKPEDTIDWLVEDDSGTLFVESKVLRLGNIAREKMAPLASIDDQYRKVAKAIGQIYATVADALAGRYPHWQPDGKPVFPLLVTMDDWNLFTHTAQGEMSELIKEDMGRRGLDLALLDQHPFAIASIGEFESVAQVIAMRDIASVMDGVTRGPKAGFPFRGYLNADFPAEVRRVVPKFTNTTVARLIAEAKRRTGN